MSAISLRGVLCLTAESGLSISFIAILVISLVALVVYSSAIIHRLVLPDRGFNAINCSSIHCSYISRRDLPEALRCDEATIRISEDLNESRISHIADELYGSPDDYLVLRDCSFPELQGAGILVVGNFSGLAKAGSALKIVRIMNTTYVCITGSCLRKPFGQLMN